MKKKSSVKQEKNTGKKAPCKTEKEQRKGEADVAGMLESGSTGQQLIERPPMGIYGKCLARAMITPRLLDYKAAGAYPCLSCWSLRELVLNGEIPHLKFGKKVLTRKLWSLDHTQQRNGGVLMA